MEPRVDDQTVLGGVAVEVRTDTARLSAIPLCLERRRHRGIRARFRRRRGGLLR
jgi:hypothetical protein